MPHKVTIFAVGGNKKLRFYKPKHYLKLFPACVPRNMNFGKGLVYNLAAALEKLVYNPVNGFLISGYG
jgi:hypothetical protein